MTRTLQDLAISEYLFIYEMNITSTLVFRDLVNTCVTFHGIYMVPAEMGYH